MKSIVKFLYSRLKEPSTWRGIVAIITAAGVTLSPEQSAAIVSAGLAGIGIVGAFFPDKVAADEG
ncbi:MAG: hypothetical protein RBR35_17410 [Salinivirgaceae bacterium]|nr:hypothetical protein [Salinivirgaceae bacterium]